MSKLGSAPLKKSEKEYTGWTGPMDFWHKNEPLPFNPDFDPNAKGRYANVTASMESDGFYDNHPLEECATEWRRRYDAEKQAGR